MTARELYDYVDTFDFSGIISDDYSDIYNAVIDYMNESQDFQFEDLFDDMVDEDLVIDIIKRELDDYGIERLYYFLGDADLIHNYLWRIDAYGNLHDIEQNNIDYIIGEIKGRLQDELEEE